MFPRGAKCLVFMVATLNGPCRVKVPRKYHYLATSGQLWDFEIINRKNSSTFSAKVQDPRLGPKFNTARSIASYIALFISVALSNFQW